MKVGNKPNNPGYIFAPYIISMTTATANESSFLPNHKIRNRYVVSIKHPRKSKIEELLEICS